MNGLAENDVMAYNPMAILHLFNNAISVQETRKLIQVKGIYLQGKGTSYNGYFYDSLRDESSDAWLTLIVPALIRNQLTHNKTIIFNGYITRKVVNSGGRIELQVTIAELVEQTLNKYSDSEVKAIEILQKKVAFGYRDATSFIKSRIINEERIRIVMLVGRNGIIDSDIKHQLRESIAEYDIVFEKINLSSESEIISAIARHDTEDTDILVVARGGGDRLEIFNSPSLADAAIEATSFFLTAIGHKEDSTLLQKVADKSFITPSELGQFLNDLYNNTQEELQNSKAKLVETITVQLKANYEQQLQNLNEKLNAVEQLKETTGEDLKKVYDERIASLNEQIELLRQTHAEQLSQSKNLLSGNLTLLQRQVEDLTNQSKSKDEMMAAYTRQIQSLESRNPATNWVAIVIAVVLGLILGIVFSR